MSLETLERSAQVIVDPAERVTAIYDTAMHLEDLWKLAGVDETSIVDNKNRLMNGEKDGQRPTRRVVSQTIANVQEININYAKFRTYAAVKPTISRKQAEYRATKFARKGEIFRAPAQRPNAIPARLR